MKKIKYPEMVEYISIADANKVQIMCKEIFENFDGGFGMYSNDDYLYHQAVNGKNIDFGFVTNGPNSGDICTYTWPPNDLKLEDYTPYTKSIRYSLLEVLFEICKILEVEFSPTKNCINDCYCKVNNICH